VEIAANGGASAMHPGANIGFVRGAATGKRANDRKLDAGTKPGQNMGAKCKPRCKPSRVNET
jgi:hypothetical protein